MSAPIKVIVSVLTRDSEAFLGAARQVRLIIIKLPSCVFRPAPAGLYRVQTEIFFLSEPKRNMFENWTTAMQSSLFCQVLFFISLDVVAAM